MRFLKREGPLGRSEQAGAEQPRVPGLSFPCRGSGRSGEALGRFRPGHVPSLRLALQPRRLWLSTGWGGLGSSTER